MPYLVALSKPAREVAHLLLDPIRAAHAVDHHRVGALDVEEHLAAVMRAMVTNLVVELRY